ncbi:hypothetical protein ACS3SW_02800 [Roseobacteraceae bacterium S113]
MTATSHYLETPKAEVKGETKEVEARTLVHVICRFIGLAMIFASMGMWLAPGANWSGEVVLMKLGVSVFFAMSGLILFLSQSEKPKE